jgi:Spy/CpxP family protein refolding chaperone
MDIFAQNKLLKRLLLVLVLLNACLIFYLFSNSNKREPLLFPKKEAFKDVSGILKKELQLTDEQSLKIQKLRDSFYIKEQVLEKTNKCQKDSMNAAMFSKNSDDRLIKYLAKSISENVYQRELLRYIQAKALKDICTPQQQEHLSEIVKEVRDYFRPDNQPIKK